jgi:putative redox protein
MANSASLTLETTDGTAGTGLRFHVRAGSGTETKTDSGRGMVAPSPVELLLAAVGGCGGMDVISILRKKRQKVLAYEILVQGERRAEHPRSFTRIEIVHRLRGENLSATAIEEAIRLSDTQYCSVHASLDPRIELVSRYEILPAIP